MISKIDFYIPELDFMKKYPKNLYYIGNLNLLKRQKVAIVGSRRPNQYAKSISMKLQINYQIKI